MAIVISGVNNNDKITATDGTIDLLSGVNYTGILTAPAFTTPGNITASGNLTAGHLNIGSGIQLGNAGIITATTLVGNVTGNVNHTSNLLLQISGSEKLRIANSGAFGLNGTNYGTSGQVLTSQGSGSSPTWTSISVPPATTINNNADNRVITGSGTANTLEGESGFTFDGTTVQVPDRINYNTNGTYLKENQLQFKPSGTSYIDNGTTGQDIQIRMSTSSSLDTTGPTFKANGNLAFAAGKGIDFSADGNNSGMDTELLDDYEEGSWTAIPSSGGTFTNCRYVKVGSLCLVTGSVNDLPTHSGSTIEIYGLPFQNRNSSASGQVTYLGALRGYDLGTNVGNSRPPTTIVLENSRIYVGTGQGNGGWDMLQYNELGNNTNAIQFNVTYQTS